MDFPAWLQEPGQGSKRIIFARHGQYECNVRGVCNCDPRTPYRLNETGRQQAIELGWQLRAEPIDIIVSSEFLRARETAYLASGPFGVPIVVNSLANENRVGSALEGRPHGEFDALLRTGTSPATAAAHDGESFLAMKARIKRLLDDLLLSSAKTILVVSHGWPLQAARALQGLVSDDDAAMCVGMPGNCGIVAGRYSREGFVPA